MEGVAYFLALGFCDRALWAKYEDKKTNKMTSRHARLPYSLTGYFLNSTL